MKEALELLNSLVADGVFERYAIGGAMASNFYVEAVYTLDLDVFVMFKPGSLLSVTSPFKAMNAIFEAAKAKGAVIKDEYIRVGKWPVQVLPPPGPLAEEGLAQAHDLEVYGVTTRVLTPEYLCAIAIDTNRDKDRVRVAEFIRQKAVDFGVLRALVEKFELTGKAAQVSNWKEVIS